MIRLVEVSPLIVVLLAALVWWSVPRQLGSTVVALFEPNTMYSARPPALATIADSYFRERDQRGLGLDSIQPGSLHEAGQSAWWEVAWQQKSFVTTTSIEPAPFPASSSVYADLRAWERKHGVRIWAWVVPKPPLPPVAIQVVENMYPLSRYLREVDGYRSGKGLSSEPASQGLVPEALYTEMWQDAPVPALQPYSIGGGGGGGDGYMVTQYSEMHGREAVPLLPPRPGRCAGRRERR